MPDILSLIVTWIWALPMFVTWTLVLTAFAYGLDARERERQLAFAQQLAQDAQLQALRYQINPHFLYNTLNSISALILDGRNKLAEEMVMRLSNFFRSSLATDALHDVPLEDEIQLQRIYLDIEKVRFEDQLEVQFDLPERLATALVPGFILQPLVENAITHGIRGPGAMTRVWIAARDEDDRLIIEVRDDGPGCSGTKRGSGVGLHNVRERLAARFNDDHDFFAGPLPTGGYRARITVPLLFPA